MNGDKVLVIAAHPDDEVLGVGGTIAKYVSHGAEVKLLIVTDGSTSQYRDDPHLSEILNAKKLETKNAAEMLGISEVIYGGMPDMRLDVTEHVKVNQVIEFVIDRFQPNIVFTQFYGDVNMDHQCVNRSTLVACRPVQSQCVKELYSYYIPSSTDWNVQNAANMFQPNVYVDISGGCAEKKYLAMKCYATELREYPHPRSIEALKILDQANGIHVGLKCAECFMAHRVMR
jgi:LmbE family N-acetylglucosaminyl deacetylase